MLPIVNAFLEESTYGEAARVLGGQEMENVEKRKTVLDDSTSIDVPDSLWKDKLADDSLGKPYGRWPAIPWRGEERH